MTPSTMTPTEIWARILELREAGREVTRAIMRARCAPAMRTLTAEWSALVRGELALLDELARRSGVAP